jgi:hypothetical protein
MQYGGLLSIRNRRVSILNSNPLWGKRRNLVVPAGMLCTALIGVTNLYGPGLQHVFGTTPIPGKFWGIPFGFALGILVVDETRKAIVRSYPKVCVHLNWPGSLADVVFQIIIVDHRENGLVTPFRSGNFHLSFFPSVSARCIAKDEIVILILYICIAMEY